MAVYDFRGTNGSGKSTLMNQILDLFGAVAVIGDQPAQGNTKAKKNVHLAYRLVRHKGVVLGRYTETGGGCDGISPPTEVERRLFAYAAKDNDVFLEGICVAHAFARYNAAAAKLEKQGIPYHFCFLDTPQEECLRRVHARRAEAGNTKPFNPKNMLYDFKRIWGTVRAECVKAGRRVTVLNHKDPLSQVLTMIGRGPQNQLHGNLGPMPKAVRMTGRD